MKKVLVLEYIDLANGLANGIHTMIRSMIAEESKLSWLVVGAREVLTNSAESDVRSDFPYTEVLEVCSINRSIGYQRRIPYSVLFSLGLLRNRNRIRRFMGEVGVMHAHRIEIGFMALLLFPKVPLVQFVHNAGKDLQSEVQSSSYWRFIPNVHTKVSGFVYRRASRIVTFSRQEYLFAKQFNQNVYQGRTWYDDKLFYLTPGGDHSPSIGESRRLELAWLGRLEAEKNPKFAIELIHRMRLSDVPVHLHLIGYGEQYGEIQEMIINLGLSEFITLHGYVEHERLDRILRLCNVFLQTSKYEGSPTSILEAMACGIPVVSSCEGDPEIMLQNGVNGFRISDWDEEEFVDAIKNSTSLKSGEIAKSVNHRSKSFVLPELLLISTSDKRSPGRSDE
jgi:glycosyltransferase involved in cell wall biosynthesis